MSREAFFLEEESELFHWANSATFSMSYSATFLVSLFDRSFWHNLLKTFFSIGICSVASLHASPLLL